MTKIIRLLPIALSLFLTVDALKIPTTETQKEYRMSTLLYPNRIAGLSRTLTHLRLRKERVSTPDSKPEDKSNVSL